MEHMELSQQSGQVLAIFHRVTTELPNRGLVSGALVLAKSPIELMFCFRPYRGGSRPAVPDLVVKALNIQNILISYVPLKCSNILITTTSPQSVQYQFAFPLANSHEALHLAQLLALHSTPPAQLCEALDFIGSSYESHEEQYHVFIITVDHGQIQMPSDFGLAKPTIEFIRPDLLIMSQFRVQADDFTKNPVSDEEFTGFPTIDVLRASAKMRGILPASRPLVWPVLFNILPFDCDARAEVLRCRTAEYLALRDQWRMMPKMQFKYNPLLCKAFTTIQADVKRTHTHIGEWREILIRILRTFAIWNCDVRYTQGLNDVALVFITVFIPVAGKLMSVDEAEALTFWCFAAFVELIGSGLIEDDLLIMQERELSQIMNIIRHFHPACAQWLVSNGLQDLRFLITSFLLAYGRSFKPEIIVRLWEALVTVEAPWLFLRYFSAALLILTFPSFVRVSSCSAGQLLSLMDELFTQHDIGAVIAVSVSMMENSREEVQVEIRNRKVVGAQMQGSGVFAPNSAFSDCYAKHGSLFL
jgi:hypothetical protein